ncbi:hypothetical protein Bhyg_11496 [Pseudolycoriella hygida]|uniref:Uncharacterized protein n=1 Tax=Pseudolycoriella hygida TaxID=35572 RepID=A0A9Q0S0A2_9DIPT|nr:hypothetical protein Bhyg_11496 [Pseudolycoriella hygida]
MKMLNCIGIRTALGTDLFCFAVVRNVTASGSSSISPVRSHESFKLVVACKSEIIDEKMKHIVLCLIFESSHGVNLAKMKGFRYWPGRICPANSTDMPRPKKCLKPYCEFRKVHSKGVRRGTNLRIAVDQIEHYLSDPVKFRSNAGLQLSSAQYFALPQDRVLEILQCSSCSFPYLLDNGRAIVQQSNDEQVPAPSSNNIRKHLDI